MTASTPEPTPVARAVDHTEPEASPLTVVVADDDETSRAALGAALEAMGNHVIFAHDGPEALAAMDRGPVDMVVADLGTPGPGALALCREVRGRSRYVYFVLATAHADRQRVLEAMTAGADDYLAKPIDPDELRARMIAATRVIQLQRALRTQNRELRRGSQRLFTAARVDALTGAKNRLALNEDLVALCSRAARYGEHACGALCDVDHFKAYNDAFGHVSGDEALRRVSDLMGRELRKGDELYRFGGEEFFVVLPRQTAESAKLAMDRVRRAVQRAGLSHAPGAAWPVVTISVGVAELRPTDSVDAWVRRVDGALYRAKSGGRNRVETAPYEPG